MEIHNYQMTQKKILQHYLCAGLTAGAVVLIGAGAGYLWESNCPSSAAAMTPWGQIVGSFLILWSILGVLGWENATWSADTPPERLNKYLFWFLNILGIFIVTLSASADLFSTFDN